MADETFDLETYLDEAFSRYFPSATTIIEFIADEEATVVHVTSDNVTTTWRCEAGSDDDWFLFESNGSVITVPFPAEYLEA